MSSVDHSQLNEILNQLNTVEIALKTAPTGEQLSDLLDLKSKLQELVSLLQGQQDDIENISSEKPETQAIDDEFAKFQMEISQLESGLNSNDDSSSDDNDETNQELMEILGSLEGNKCRAPFSQDWGEMDYHNAMITSAECSTVHNMDSLMVKVMFCNPICDQMKPCSFFLNGHCKFSEDKCRYSHGHEVKFSDLQEFVLPDFSEMNVDSKCLAKAVNGIWDTATVEKVVDDQKYMVKYDKTGKTVTVDAQDILPLGFAKHEQSDNEDDKEDDENSYHSYHEPIVMVSYNSSTPGLWEQYTKGIGSKLMEKMGHIWGKGLGKNSDGRLDPIEAVILPAGKSLDKCIKMRESCNPQGPVAIESRLSLDKEKEEQRAKRIKINQQFHGGRKKSVFDFINSKISNIKSENDTLDVRKNAKLVENEPSTSNHGLNVQIFTVGEDIRKAKRELARLQQSLVRNAERNKVVKQQVEKKIKAQKDILTNLEAKERRIGENIKSQTNHKKLSIF